MEYQIKNLGAVGVVADLAPTDLPPNAFTDAINARFVDARVYKSEGSTPISYHNDDKTKKFLSVMTLPFDSRSAGNSFLIAGDYDKNLDFDNSNLCRINENSVDIINRRTKGGKISTALNVKVLPKVATLAFDKSTIVTPLGQDQQIVAYYTPKNAKQPVLTWRTNNPLVATVTAGTPYMDPEPDEKKNRGMLFPATIATADTGIASISAITANGDVAAYAALTVTGAEKGLTINATTLNLRRNGSASVTATLNQLTGDIHWASSNPTIATVSAATGSSITINALTVGTVTVTATHTEAGVDYTDTVTVNVASAITKVELSETDILAEIGAEHIITATLTPATNIPDSTVQWIISDSSIFEIKEGASYSGLKPTIVGKAKGSATITVKTNDGGLTDFAAVTITPVNKPVYLVKSFTAGKVGGNDNPKEVGKDYDLTLTTVGTDSGNPPVDKTAELLAQDEYVVNVNSSNESVLTVALKPNSKTEVIVHTVAIGTANIIASAVYNGFNVGNATVPVTVAPPVVAPSSITVTPNPVTGMTSGTPVVLTAVVGPTNATDKTAKWPAAPAGFTLVDNNDNTATLTATATTTTATTFDVEAHAASGVKTTVTIPSVAAPIIPVQSVTHQVVGTGDVTDMKVGQEIKLKAVVTPPEANQKVIWNVDTSAYLSGTEDPSDNTFTIKALLATPTSTVATVSMKSVGAKADGTFATHVVSVTTKEVTPTSVVINHNNTELTDFRVGNTTQLTATANPQYADSSVTWASSAEDVARVSVDGLVTAVKPGTANITATSKKVTTVASVPLTVTVKAPIATSLTLVSDGDEEKLEVGKTQKFTVLAQPQYASTDVTFVSADTNKVTVDANGTIHGIAIGGPVNITATAKDTATSPATVVKAVTVIAATNP